MSNNPLWNAVTAGQISLVLEVLGEHIKDVHAQSGDSEELAALGEVHRALYHERQYRIQQAQYRMGLKAPRHRRRNIR